MAVTSCSTTVKPEPPIWRPDSDQVTEILKGGTAVCAARILVFPRAGKLWAQALNLKSWKPIGDPTSVVDEVGYASGSAYPPVAASANGVLAYWNGTTIDGELLWFNRSGNLLPSSDGSSSIPGNGTLSLSPDGRQIARTLGGDIWLFNPSGARSRFSFAGGSWPIWSADGRRLLFRTGQQLVERAISGAERDRPVGNTLSFEEFPTDWSADGRLVLLHTLGSATGWDIETMSAETGKRELLLQKPENEFQGRLSPTAIGSPHLRRIGQMEVCIAVAVDGCSRRSRSMADRSRSGAGWAGTVLPWRRSATLWRPASIPVVVSRRPPHALFDTRMRSTFIHAPVNYATTDGQRF
jgi:hypothetical protein